MDVLIEVDLEDISPVDFYQTLKNNTIPMLYNGIGFLIISAT